MNPRKFRDFSKGALLQGMCLFWAVTLSAQTPDTIWTKTFGGSDHDYAYDVRQTSDGGYIMAGMTASYGTGWWNIYLVKTDPDGDTIWTRFFSADGPDIAYSIQQTDDDGYIVACEGFTNLLKTDESGDSLWTRDYGMLPQSAQQTSDGGYIVGGSFIAEASSHASIVKTDATGDSIWHRYYVIGDVSNIVSIQQTTDGCYFAAGHTHSMEGCWDYFLMKVDPSGEIIWSQIYGRDLEADEAYAAMQTADGGYIITGLYFWTLKTDASGDTLWTRHYGSGEMGCSYSIEQTNDGGYIMGGYVDPFEGEDEAQFYLVKTDPLGSVVWERTYGTENGWDFGRCIRQTNDGGYVVTGWTDSFGEGGMDIWLLRLESESSACSYTPGDCDHNGTPVELSDVIAMIGMYRGTVDPAYTCDCPPHGSNFAPEADPNGNCVAFELGDVVTEIAAYRGTGQASGCVDCPGSP